ncbi:prolipoprotein diacylglyceryl transferase [Caminibacter mediatlanticus TB-2]|uniref:Phosphatidylglycerol--prolipoprotein diacylglyceryl transferase n=1 Tax=Caminibacter mediatlanticus TB-2 TaxID=391592 RepID=A0ABX5V7U5_9BACT|nr:prolipoprotein diacylglyceryl transferase [Caminibacter mediatlanticus]QCT94352.1 prolipoprotein diacylglyceryl transferase [Caminibacter mediatlanticus TB-2]
MIEYWQHIYSHFNPVAFSIFGFKIHWYALMYITALIVGYLAAVKFGEKFGFDKKVIDEYFIWAEIGIILGARIGYFIFYVPNNSYYLFHPWEMFNPFVDGKLVGIRGMSYHGAVIGFIISTLIFWKVKKIDLWKLMDVVALSVPLGYIFGRIGNFLNQELFGRVTDVPWGIYVNGVLRHPSQLYEAFFEGLVTFLIIYFYYNKWYKCKGELIGLYLFLYGVFRSFCEMFREPDPQLGFIFMHFTMGEILSSFMIVGGILLYIIRRKSCKS